MDGSDGISAPGGRSEPITCLDSVDAAAIERTLASGDFLWLNLRDGEEISALAARAGKLLGLHELTIEDLEHFGQRAKIEEYDEYVYIVAYGAAPSDDPDRLVEVHIVYSPNFLFTVARDESPELHALHARSAGSRHPGQQLLHAVLDILVDSFAPLLDDIDQQIEEIEEKIFERKLREREVDIHNVRRQLVQVVRITHRQSETYTRLRETLRRLPDHHPEQAPYFRDVQDHLIRVADSADSLRDRVQGLFEIYLAALDNRQNIIMKQFTVIAGIFLPLTVVVGFFGQNFRWMVDNVASSGSFVLLGLVLPAVIVAVLLLVIWRRGFFED
ncbi:MAG: magnesium transporter CorA family protein [Actinobacteria bacterium]|nr:magnesium transporter CorA family protein [Actinomycetota bacterium]